MTTIRCLLLASLFVLTRVTSASAQSQADEDKTWGSGATIKGNEAPGYVAFTFDDGPHPETTPLIMEALEEFGVPATFFVVGRRFGKKNPARQAGLKLLSEMAERGFTIGNHTTQHRRLDQQSIKSGEQSIDRNASALAELLGFRPRLFRPPFGVTTNKIKKYLHKRNVTTVRWSIDPRDFRRGQNGDLRERLVNQILDKSGGVVLLHDTKPWTARALPGILADLQEANCLRLSRGEQLIIPVSLHYFMRNRDGGPREIPGEVLSATQKTVDFLTKRCKKDD